MLTVGDVAAAAVVPEPFWVSPVTDSGQMRQPVVVPCASDNRLLKTIRVADLHLCVPIGQAAGCDLMPLTETAASTLSILNPFPSDA